MGLGGFKSSGYWGVGIWDELFEVLGFEISRELDGQTTKTMAL